MPISFTDHFKINRQIFKKTGAFDPILDVDTHFFIDPALICLSKDIEFANAEEIIKKFFLDIIRLLKFSKEKGDVYWRAANSKLNFKEIRGTCLGYSGSSTDGTGIGSKYREIIINAIKEIIDTGTDAPELFELLGVFCEGIGSDRISDLICYVIRDNIYRYTERIINECKIINHETLSKVKIDGKIYNLLINPFNNQPVLLIPAIILSPLPVAESFEDIVNVCNENERVRKDTEQYINFSDSANITKKVAFELFHHNNFAVSYINAYREKPRKQYDFNESNTGEYIWYEHAKESVAQHPLRFIAPKKIDEVITVVKTICNQFKYLIENNNLNNLLYNGKKPKRESASQLLFFGIADTYCKANNVDLSREVNNGRGPVDFKLSRGLEKVVVEIKLSSNKQFIQGFENQLPIYMKQENTKKAIYLVLKVNESKQLNKFINTYDKLSKEKKEKIEFILIDATLKKSASKV